MQKRYIYAIGVIGALFVIWFLWLGFTAPTVERTEDARSLLPQFSTNGHTFFCSEALETESDCKLVAGDDKGNTVDDLDITLDYGGEKTSLLLSPDQAYALVVLENEAIVIDTKTLEKRTIATTTTNQTFGVYTEFPSFKAIARWVDARSVELSIYKENTPEALVDSTGKLIVPEPTPVTKKAISL